MAIFSADKAAPEPALGPEMAGLSLATELLTKSIERLDREIATMRSDFHPLFGAVIASALGLAGLIAKTAHWSRGRRCQLNARPITGVDGEAMSRGSITPAR